MAIATAWIPLLSAFIAVGGVVFTQHRADRRAADERADQRRQERERWAREDAARTYEHRRDAYTEFLRVHDSYGRAALEHSEYDPDPEPEDLDNLYVAYEQVVIFGTREAETRAKLVADEMSNHLLRGTATSIEPLLAFRDVVRRDLGVPDHVGDLQAREALPAPPMPNVPIAPSPTR